MPADLRTLLAQEALGLRLLSREDELPAGALSRPIPWVHSSDLPDPTPFLTPGVVLLTTGTQFGSGARVSRASARAYVSRLAAGGVGGVGFGTEVIRDGTPGPLAAACAEHGLPLFEVPYRTPFIAVAQASTAAATAEADARRRWFEEVQRAIARAALRPDGLSAILAEVAARLGRWVGLFDIAAGLDRQFPSGALPEQDAAPLRREVERLLRRGRRAGAAVQIGPRRILLQTLGQGERLSGVLALEAAGELDAAGQDVLGSVIAFAGLALERGKEVNEARSLLRTGLLHALLGGDTALAERISPRLWGPLPQAPVEVVVAEVPVGARDLIEERLELWVRARPGAAFFALDGERLVLLVEPPAVPPLLALLQGLELRAGVSAEAGYPQLPRALVQAQRAQGRARAGGRAVVRYSELVDDGLLRLLVQDERARALAGSALAPVRAHDAEHGTALLQTARAWVECDCEQERTARRLGVHRHTVRARIAVLEELLGRDLSGSRARADLLAALLASE